jgi:hypothetical protein
LFWRRLVITTPRFGHSMSISSTLEYTRRQWARLRLSRVRWMKLRSPATAADGTAGGWGTPACAAPGSLPGSVPGSGSGSACGW